MAVIIAEVATEEGYSLAVTRGVTCWMVRAVEKMGPLLGSVEEGSSDAGLSVSAFGVDFPFDRVCVKFEAAESPCCK